MPNTQKILKEVLEKKKISNEEYNKLKQITERIINELKNIIKNKRISAEIFIGGSFAKSTLIKKQKYDIDIFVRFNKKYKENGLSLLLEKIIKNLKLKEKNKLTIKKIHGSRDYFQIEIRYKKVLFEVIPILKIKNQKEAKNVTDLSYFHVNYIKNKIKQTPKLADEIVLAKTFCYANNCYGAESYIKGFSGYALELLICRYKTFLNFLKQIAELKINETQKEKLIIDVEKHYKSKQDIMLNINASKMQSPIILIDPTFRERNALAALSTETFLKFQKACKAFLNQPSKKFFEKKEFNMQKLENYAMHKKNSFIKIEIKTNKQEGDIAGSKLLKFYNFLTNNIEKQFDILKKEFIYNEKQTAFIFLITKPKKEIIIKGPPINAIENVNNFRKKHKNCFIKNNIVYAREKLQQNIRLFLKNFKQNNKKLMKEMGITEVKV